jgi:hypothetical protein
MKKTILSHIYNEEYLLPYWLNHHKKYFDHGIIIDYKSTDRSIEIIKEICPTWEIHTTKNEYFYAPIVDTEVCEYEKNIEGFRIVLNTTEFLFGNYEKLEYISKNTQFLIGANIMVDSVDTEFTEIESDLFKERQYGISRYKKFGIRSCRSFHNYYIDYPSIVGPGRHFRPEGLTCHHMEIDKSQISEDFFILWYGFSPFNENLVKRKLQIQTKHHPSGEWSGGHNISEFELISIFKSYQSDSEDLSEEINKFL